MVGRGEFLKIFRDAGFSREALCRFHRSIKKSITLFYAGRRGLPLLLGLAEKDQWPILKEIDDPNLSIYEGADPELLAAFIETIKKQKENNSWPVLREAALKRAGLYEMIFDFSPQEIEACKRAGKRFEEILARKGRKRRLMVGGGVAAAGAAGAGIFLWWKTREKK